MSTEDRPSVPKGMVFVPSSGTRVWHDSPHAQFDREMWLARQAPLPSEPEGDEHEERKKFFTDLYP